MHAYTTTADRTAALGALSVLAVALAIGANWLAERVSLGPAWLISPPAVAASFGLMYEALDRYAWRWSILRRLGIVQVPDVEGAYEGELISSSNDITRSIRIVIDQTWTRIAVRFDIVEPSTSTSYSIAAALAKSGHDQVRLTYTYKNQVRPGVADVDMSDHDGTAEVVIDTVGNRMDGRYFNFRGRQGTLMLRRADH